jgi:hypothetical protein
MPAPENKMVTGVANKVEGVCPICGGRTVVRVLHLDGYTPGQLLAHAAPQQPDPIALANPLNEVELATQAEVAAAKVAYDAAKEELRLFREKLDLAEGGDFLTGDRWERIKPDPAKHAECLALEPILIRALEAADLRARTASGKWHALMAARSQRIERLRLEHEQELLRAGKKGKESLVAAGMARIRAIIRA